MTASLSTSSGGASGVVSSAVLSERPLSVSAPPVSSPPEPEPGAVSSGSVVSRGSVLSERPVSEAPPRPVSRTCEPPLGSSVPPAAAVQPARRSSAKREMLALANCFMRSRLRLRLLWGKPQGNGAEAERSTPPCHRRRCFRAAGRCSAGRYSCSPARPHRRHRNRRRSWCCYHRRPRCPRRGRRRRRRGGSQSR